MDDKRAAAPESVVPLAAARGRSRAATSAGWRSCFRSAIFAIVVAFLFVGLFRDPREVPSPLVDRPAPAFALADLQPARPDRRDRGLQGPGLAAQRLGVVVRLVPRRASAAASSSRRRRPSRSSDSTTRTRTPKASRGSRSTAIPYTLSVVDADGRVGIDWGVYGVPETFVVDKAGLIRYKHIGPVTAEALQRQDPAARAQAAAVVSASRALRCSPRRSPATRRARTARARPRVRGAPEAPRSRPALPRLPEPDARRLERAARRGPAPRGAHARVAGKSDDEIRAFLVARYGDFVLYRPPVKGTTWLLWFGPFALLFGGAGVWLGVVRRRRGGAAAPSRGAAPQDATARARAMLDDATTQDAS